MKRLIVLMLVLMSCSANIETFESENLERRPQVECGEAVLPNGINRQDVIDRLNSTGEISNGFSEIQVTIAYEKTNKRILFGRLWNGGVQYNFTLSNENGAIENGCVTVTSAYSTFYDINLRHGNYTITFDDFPEVTREYNFEVTRGR